MAAIDRTSMTTPADWVPGPKQGLWTYHDYAALVANRKSRDLPKTHIVDALCLATYQTGEQVAVPETNIYTIRFRPRQTRKQYHSLPQKGQGRVRYQRYEELGGFRKGDIVRVKGKWIKQVNAIYAEGRLAFRRVKEEPLSALPRDCQLLEREKTIIWDESIIKH